MYHTVDGSNVEAQRGREREGNACECLAHPTLNPKPIEPRGLLHARDEPGQRGRGEAGSSGSTHLRGVAAVRGVLLIG